MSTIRESGYRLRQTQSVCAQVFFPWVWVDRQHSHHGSSPLDDGCEESRKKDRPIDHDNGLLATTTGLWS